MVMIGTVELRRKDNLITLLHVIRKFVFCDKVNAFGRFVYFVTDLKRQKVPVFEQRSRGEVGKGNSLRIGTAVLRRKDNLIILRPVIRKFVALGRFVYFVTDMGLKDAILYYMHWIFWAIYNTICVPCLCCDERFEVLFHDYETRNFTYLFGKWVCFRFKLNRWEPGSSWDTHQPILCVCEEKTRHIADMYGALEDFSDNQLQKTIFVYITNYTDKNFRMPEGDRYFSVPVICVPKEKSWESAKIFRKAVTSLLEQYKSMTSYANYASERTRLTKNRIFV